MQTADTIRHVLSRLYDSEIENDQAIGELTEMLSPEALAEFIVDAFNRGWITPFNLGFN